MTPQERDQSDPYNFALRFMTENYPERLKVNVSECNMRLGILVDCLIDYRNMFQQNRDQVLEETCDVICPFCKVGFPIKESDNSTHLIGDGAETHCYAFKIRSLKSSPATEPVIEHGFLQVIGKPIPINAEEMKKLMDENTALRKEIERLKNDIESGFMKGTYARFQELVG